MSSGSDDDTKSRRRGFADEGETRIISLTEIIRTRESAGGDELTASKAPPAAPEQEETTRLVSREELLKQLKQHKPAKEGPPKPLAAAPSVAAGEIQVVLFFSCKGGAGATFCAANIAEQYAKEGKKVCLLDLDLQFGDVLAGLHIASDLSIARAQKMMREGVAFQADMFPKTSTGTYVLSQVGSLNDLDMVKTENIPLLLTELRSAFDLILVDGVRDFSDTALAVLDVTDRIALVMSQDVLAIRRARWAYKILGQIGYSGGDIALLVNKYHHDPELNQQMLAQLFKPTPTFRLIDEAQTAQAFLSTGRPVAEARAQSTLVRHIKEVSRALLGHQVKQAPDVEEKASWLDRLMPWRK